MVCEMEESDAEDNAERVKTGAWGSVRMIIAALLGRQVPRNSLLGSLAAPLLINLEGIEGLTTRVQVRLRSMGGRGESGTVSLLGQVRFEARRAQIFQRGGHLQFELWLCFPLNKRLVAGEVERYLRRWSSVRRCINVLEKDQSTVISATGGVALADQGRLSPRRWPLLPRSSTVQCSTCSAVQYST
ncbi:hypothetical protein NA56DRAFT_416195 [Hyaloscypha hepaticicola]|uniref:Uncharacterized protein n=1 Tax=Hyaloscypha hepaticicola TaxID=2082293 RepID=A0A2J6PHW4_9HELO|nr:hypothetical protein NA56DRAFT_416195 [Hyaloscypha hepaticicola]